MSEKIDNRQLLVIKASAGSGKTYNLALQYIRHLLFTTSGDGDRHLVPRRQEGDDRILNAHRQLLAITFTNKATDEMKQRIVDELYRLSRPGVESKYLKGLIAETHLTEERVRTLARQALTELLFDYSNFNVSTIDSFFQSILRNFARELNRDYNYDIQLEEDYAVRVAVHKFLLSLGQEGKPTQVDLWVKEYQRHLIRDDADKKNWKFFDDSGDLNKFAKQINSELFRSRMGEIRSYLGYTDEDGFHSDFRRIREFKKCIHARVAFCQSQLDDGLEALKQALAPVVNGLSGSRSLKKWFVKDSLEPLTDTMENTDEQKIREQFLKSFSPSDELVVQLLGLVRGHFRLKYALAFYKHIENNLGLLGMLAMIDLFLEEYRHESNSILIGDTNELIGTVLDSGSDFVYERVGTTIAHFMIDEFQDTSAKQYENFRGLLQESLANGHFNMLIGDAKQSIYRFRNADPTVFRERVGDDFGHDIIEGNMGGGAERDETRPSSVNYRSSRAVIEFNNRLFEYVRDVYCAGNATVAATYGDVRQGFPDDVDTMKLPGYIRLYMAGYGQLLTDGAVPEGGVDADLQDTTDVLAVLPHLLLQLHERYDWGRIGILVNRNVEGNQVVDCILNHNKQAPADEQISIISGESLLLSNSPIIRRIIAMLRYIDISRYGADDEEAADESDLVTDGDDVARRIQRKRQSDQRLYTALNEFIHSISEDTAATPADHGRMLVDSLEKAADAMAGGPTDSRQALEGLLPQAGELTTLVSIIETIIAHFKQGTASADDVDRETAFLYAFQDAVMQFSAQRNGGSVREFLKYWDEKSGSLAVSGAASGDAINIMSIHKAKGLEFDCVILPYANWEIDDSANERNYWMPREVFMDVMAGTDMEATDCAPEMIPPLLHVNKKAAVQLMQDGALGQRAAAFVGKQVTDVLIDNLNKTYVAMTRPRTELHIFAGGKSPAGTVGALLSEFVANGGLLTPVLGKDKWYETGTFSTRADFEDLERRKRELEANRQDDRPEVIRMEISQYIANAIPVDLQVRMENLFTPARKAGLRLHSLLSRIHDRNDVDRVIEQGIKHGLVTDDAHDPCSRDSIELHVRRPITEAGCRAAAWFDPANVVYSERTITAAAFDENGVQVGIKNQRPDRIVRRPGGGMLVIDYKSGERDDRTYCRQIGFYIAKLRTIFPGTPIEGRIWYVTHDVILDEKGRLLDFNAAEPW